MLKMIEVVGVSEISYENAVKNAINELISNNYNIHFFNVIEHRGSYRDEKIQFQAVLKVAVDFVKKTEQQSDSKPIKPKTDHNEITCEWCGCSMQVPKEFYKDNPSRTLVCNNCGRILCINEKYCKSKLK